MSNSDMFISLFSFKSAKSFVIPPFFITFAAHDIYSNKYVIRFLLFMC
jgi:hypothetical protein